MITVRRAGRVLPPFVDTSRSDPGSGTLPTYTRVVNLAPWRSSMTKLLTSKLLGSAPARSRRGRSVGRLNVARTACLIFAFCTAAAIASPAQTFDILFEFQGFDGSDPSDSPVQGFFETGLRMCPLEKRRDRSPLCRRAARSLKSGLPVNNREIRALFAYFGADRAKILCSSDCMAEEERFKLSVRFCRAKALSASCR